MRNSFLGAMLVCLAPMLAPVHAQAGPLRGADLFDACKPGASPVESASCDAYILGAIEGIGFGGLILLYRGGAVKEGEDAGAVLRQAVGFCTPDGVTQEGTRQLVIDYLAANSDAHGEEARVLVWKALVDSYPCLGQDGD
ncbi:Rap1a/Tai family immunity protein [Rhodovulum sp. DZ06]|uniref:Rap1a/Tai family immunity protein n=1 Tax=Rhodovulum sp. DZ06 TaxID=3425126 RepID=UPI003D3344D8